LLITARKDTTKVIEKKLDAAPVFGKIHLRRSNRF
jgi:hypothetical protein